MCARTPTSPLRAALVAVLAVLVVASAAMGAAPDLEDLLWELQILPLDGEPPPAFDLEALDGRRWSLADLRGRAALLYFLESG